MSTSHVTVVLEGTTAVFTYHGDLSREFSPNADCGGRLAILSPEPIDLTNATSFELVGSDADIELIVQNGWDQGPERRLIEHMFAHNDTLNS